MIMEKDKDRTLFVRLNKKNPDLKKSELETKTQEYNKKYGTNKKLNGLVNLSIKEFFEKYL
jgi:hypothetical protein